MIARVPALCLVLIASLPARPAWTQCSPDAHEPDDLCRQGLPWPEMDDARVFNFCDDPVDWFELGACEGRSHAIEATALGSRAAPVIAVLAEDCETVLAEDLDGDGRLVWVATDARRAFLRVSEGEGRTGADTGYELHVGTSEAAAEHVVRLLEGADSDGMAASGEGLIVESAGSGGEWFAATTLDAGGAPLGRTTWDSPCSSRGLAAATDDGGLLALGAEIGMSFDTACVARIDPDRSLAIGVEIPELVPWRAVDAGDGGLLVGGKVLPDVQQDVGLVRLDAAGSVVWQARLDLGSVDDVHGLVRLAGGDFVLVVDSIGSVAPHSMARLAADGSALAWARGLEMPSGLDVHSPALFVDASPLGGFVVLGGCLAGFRPCADPDLFLAGFDDDGLQLWQLRLDSGADDHPFGLDVAADGSLFVTAGRTTGPELPQPFVAKVDGLGRLSWARALSDDRIVRSAVAATADGGVAVTTATSGPAIFVTRLDADGALTEGCPSFAELPLSELPVDPLVTFDAALELLPLALSPVAAAWAERRDLPPSLPACDCACRTTEAPSEVSPPGSPRPLRVDKRGAEVVLSWAPRGEPAQCRHDLHRGELAGLHAAVPAACWIAELGHDEAVDPDAPPPSGSYYLVTASGPLGDGTPGFGSEGVERTVDGCGP